MARFDPPAPVAPRVQAIRVFLSSTFRDMQAERDELVKRVFPRLRQLCESRGVTFHEVDLRWGVVTDEATMEGTVLEYCLEEIDRCRPFFIGLLGERLGWVPDCIPAHLSARHAWLQNETNCSVTELEMLHGALLAPAKAPHAYFYFRDPAYCETVPSERRHEFVEPSLTVTGSVDGKSRHAQLVRLKDRVRACGVHLREGFSSARELGDLVLQDLGHCIDLIVPPGMTPTWLDRQRAAHDAFADTRHRHYVEPPGIFDVLDALQVGSGPPLVVLGASGSGKSALVANWSARARERDAVPVIRHFVGASPSSGELANMLRHIMAELQQRLRIDADLPESDDDLPSAFGNWLHLAASRGRAVILIDAVEELQDRGGARQLTWLPERIPEGIRLVVSSKPGPEADRLTDRGWATLSVPPLRRAEQIDIIRGVLRAAGKFLAAPYLEVLLAAPQIESPLFLRTLLEELRVFGHYESLDERIQYYLNAPTVGELFDRVLSRYETDYDTVRPGLVRGVMQSLWAARHGLSEPELQDLVGGPNPGPLPSAHWLPLRTAASALLVDRGGLIGLAHDYVRRAIEHRYLGNNEDVLVTRRALADYFDQPERRSSARGLGELPWQLAQANEWNRLEELLGDVDFFEPLWEMQHWDARAYWTQLIDRGRSPVHTYAELLEDATRCSYRSLWNVGSLLFHLGYLKPAVTARRQLVQRSRTADDDDALLSSLQNLAIVLEAAGKPDEAMQLLEETESLARMRGDEYEVQSARLNRAGLLHLRGALDEAYALQDEAAGFFRALGHRDRLRAALGNQVLIHVDRGEWLAASAKLDEQQHLAQELDDQAALARCIDDRGHLWVHRNDLVSALEQHRAAETIFARIGDRRGLSRCLNNQGAVLGMMRRLDEALEIHRAQETLARELGDQRELMASLGNQALIYDNLGQDDVARALLERAEQLALRLDDPEMLHRVQGQRAQILIKEKRFEEALSLVEKKEAICRRLGVVDSLQRALSWKGQILASMERFEAAVAAHTEEAELCRCADSRRDLASALRDLGQALVELGRFEQALDCFEEAEQISDEESDHDGLARTLMLQGFAAVTVGDLAAARGLAHEAGQLVLTHDLDGLHDALHDLLEIINDAGG